jgi:hypothetical protein
MAKPSYDVREDGTQYVVIETDSQGSVVLGRFDSKEGADSFVSQVSMDGDAMSDIMKEVWGA